MTLNECPRCLSALAVGLVLLLLATDSTTAQTGLVWTNLAIPTRDAKTLDADLWHAPPALTPKPVILIQTPYNKNRYRLGAVPGYASPSFPVSTNYHYVIVDWRGFYGSGAAAVPGYDRGLDGFDCVEWIARQPWSNARVGTWGGSALGFIQYQTTFHHPSNLVCCTIAVKDFQTRYDNYYYGGDFRKEHVENLERLQLADADVILSHPAYDLVWRTLEAVGHTPERMSVPALIVGGWFDHFPDTVLRSFSDLQLESDAAMRDQHRLIFGPWLHGEVGKAQQGALTFSNATNLEALEIAFWDYHLRDQTDNGWASQPVVQFYQMGENIWLQATNWQDLPRLNRSLYLRAGGLLTPEPPEDGEHPDPYTYDPNDPTPAFGGSRFNPFDPGVLEGPQDQSASIETRADVLVYSTPILTNDLRVNGALRLTLYASSDRTDTDFAVRLADVQPDGRSLIMTQGIRRGRFRDSLSTPNLMTPGVAYPFEIELQNLALTFRAGHRLRLVIASAIYPHFDRNLNDGGPMYTTGTPLVATNSVFHDPFHLSRLDFQVLPDDADGDGLPDVWEADSFGTLARDGTGDFDGDGFSDRNEYLAGTQAANAASLLEIESVRLIAPAALEIAWQSVSNRTYDLLAAAGSPTAESLALATNLVATPPLNSLTVGRPPGTAVFFRVQTEP